MKNERPSGANGAKTRREFMEETALFTAAAAVAAGSPAQASPPQGASPSPAALPTIRIGTLEVSRLILGSNPFYGFSHEPEDNRQMKAWYTDLRIMEVLNRAADAGITAVASPPYDRWIRLFEKYLQGGGRLRTWIAQPDPAGVEEMSQAIEAAAKGGAKAIFIQGQRTDAQFGAGRFEVLRRWIDQIRGFGLPAGLASHRPDVHLEIERRKLPTDFYFQCFYNPGRYDPEDRDKAVAAIRQIDKPVVGYKICAAGRKPAREGLAFALAHLRPTDGLCVGVFPPKKEDMIEENAGMVRERSPR